MSVSKLVTLVTVWRIPTFKRSSDGGPSIHSEMATTVNHRLLIEEIEAEMMRVKWCKISRVYDEIMARRGGAIICTPFHVAPTQSTRRVNCSWTFWLK